MKNTIGLISLCILVGCDERPPTVKGENTVNVATNGYDAAVRIIRTTDGTRCAVMVGYGRGGITCDWEGSRKEEQPK